MARGSAIVKRLPRPWWRPPDTQHLVPPDARTEHPSLAADYAVLEEILMPAFRAADGSALRQQNTFYLVQVTLIVGSALATVLGAVQAALGGGQLAIGLVEAVLAAFLGAGAVYAYSRSAQQTYYTTRLQAERLRSEYFLFLGRQQAYAYEARRVRSLRDRVETIWPRLEEAP